MGRKVKDLLKEKGSQVCTVEVDASICQIPVLQDEKLPGILTIGDIVKRLLTEKNSRIENLEQFACEKRYRLIKYLLVEL